MNIKHMISVFIAAILCITIAPFETAYANDGIAAKIPDSITDTGLNNKKTSTAGMENPFNKQDDMEVPYDGRRWVQPVEWNMPTINPRNYEGGLMIFFDQITLEHGKANGKVQRVYCSIHGATEPVSIMKFHIFYDTRLTVKKNGDGEVINPGKVTGDFNTGSAMVEEGQLVFYAYSDDTAVSNGSIFTIDFIVPQNAEPGEVYPIGMAYVDDGIVADTFINSEQDYAGKLQMTYAFSKGIYNGYIKMSGEKKTTTTTTTTSTTTTTTLPVMPARKLGDENGDGSIDAIDASRILAIYAEASIEGGDLPTEEDYEVCDVDRNGSIDAVDASKVLAYYAYTGGGGTGTFEDFLKKK
ncbi:dockerin type I domain-containing protein [uncultured Ruminococcus sp.]|uniref:dockerin type I domain-containing protein n=1 Tax=uncultured Ruminococcus sp. TaxID=165186 RepID=UPI002605E6CF|nr:dockerin type I domain-containing protein [uncultured Ruminococcus sp.]